MRKEMTIKTGTDLQTFLSDALRRTAKQRGVFYTVPDLVNINIENLATAGYAHFDKHNHQCDDALPPFEFVWEYENVNMDVEDGQCKSISNDRKFYINGIEVEMDTLRKGSVFTINSGPDDHIDPETKYTAISDYALSTDGVGVIHVDIVNAIITSKK